MAWTPHKRLFVVLSSAALLSGCGDNFTGFQGLLGDGSGGASSQSSSSSNRRGLTPAEREVEAPNVFQAREKALWDGRPSLGGVWVAAPGVAQPERVIIRNEENGNIVIGALFRRERENPGPRLQLSSDAANALEALPGAPTTISVVALRKEEAQSATPVVNTSTPPISNEGAIETASNTAVTQLDPSTGRALEPEPEPQSASSLPFFGRRAEQPSAANGFDTATAGTAAAGTVAQPAVDAPVDIAATASTAIARSEAVEATAQPAPPPPAPVDAPRPSNLEKPYIQVGIFAVQSNADKTADRLRSEGILPIILAQESASRPFWRVIVGPATSRTERRTLLNKVRGIGYSDAYAVTN